MRIVKHIPNTITSVNLLCGVLGMIFTFEGRLDWAFYSMLIASVCDFCDGLSARLLNAYSNIGKELDSLADVVSFGVLPSLMLYKLMTVTAGNGLYCYIPLIIAVLSGVRLAKFNVDERQTENFIGLPTPACAIICGSFAYFVSVEASGVMAGWAATKFFIPVCSVLLSLLLVSELPMFSMKFKKNSKSDAVINRLRICFAATVAISVALVIILGLNWSFAILVTFVSYIVLNAIAYPFSRK